MGVTQLTPRQILQIQHHYPHPKDGIKVFPPSKFWILGGVPVCIAKDGGEKLTSRGQLDEGERKICQKVPTTSSIFDARMWNLQRGVLWWGTSKKICPNRSVLCHQHPLDFQVKRANLAKWPAVWLSPLWEQPIHPWSEWSGENINSTPPQTPKEKKTNVRVILMDKQFETPLLSRSNSPHSESSFTPLFLSQRGELISSPPSSSF